jgi:carbamoyltransferase
MSFVLGLGGPYYHDGSACLVSAGEIVAFAEEERFTRIKHNTRSRSCALSAAYCLSAGGIRLEDVDEVAISWNPVWPESAEYIKDEQLIAKLLGGADLGKLPERLRIVDHHLAHAASAFYPSGFEHSAVLVVDGAGDGVSTTIFRGDGSGLTPIRQYPYTQSLGWLYEAATEYVGLGDANSAGKLMGLAAYGTDRIDLDFVRERPEGYEIDLTRFGLRPEPHPDPSELLGATYIGRLKSAYYAAYESLGIPGQPAKRTFDPAAGTWHAKTAFTTAHVDLAASVQGAVERCMIQLARAGLSETGETRLCLAGGVGLNCTVNGRLLQISGLDDLFVQPASHDAGCAIGAALETARQQGDLPTDRPRMTSAALGPCFSPGAVKKLLDDVGVSYRQLEGDLPGEVANLLADGAVVAWFDGRAEAGPRALGHRSILADPRFPDSRSRINETVKRRESWRPFAPSILASRASEYIQNPRRADFMIVAYAATEKAQAALPATVHIDGSVRPQIVEDDSASAYVRVLQSFEGATGTPALLNTSFNHEAEPMVLSPLDALRTFFSAPIDALAMEGFLVSKPAAPSRRAG